MKTSILIVISIFLSTGVFAYEKEYKYAKSGNFCCKGLWMNKSLFTTCKGADETAHWSDMYESEAEKNRKCPNGKKYMIETVEEKKKLLRNQVIKNSGKEQTNRVKRVKNLKLTNGNFYTGEMKNGDPNGQGTETFPNGQKYVGEFKDGKENGYGTYTWFDGEKYVGEHKDGRFWNGIYYDKNGNITTKFVNGQEWAGY